YEHEVVKKWTEQIAASDGFVFVTSEYNYGPPAVLKNAIDWVYPEWNRKAAAFVSYGSAMGARAVQQLRETAVELQMAPIRSSVHIPVATLWAHFQGGDVEKGLAELEKQANVMIDALLWWTAALKTPHETVSKIGPTAHALVLDVSQEEQWRSAAVQTREVGEVDIVVNNAG